MMVTDFGLRMRVRREALGMTQQDVADASGLTPAAISHFESGRRLPNLLNAVRVARALDTTVEALALGTATLDDRVSALERRMSELDTRTTGSIFFGGPRR